MSDSPYNVSQSVLGAVSLVNPFEYGGEYSPYLTVYDSQLSQYQSVESDYIFGGTNPLFLKLFSHKNITIISLDKPYCPRRHLRPLKELFVLSSSEEQCAVN